MIKLKKLTLKNFMSIGNVEQTIDFEKHGFTLILGENLDLGGGSERNGVGKTAIANALSFALYGSSITPIRKENLVNKINNKNMNVSVEFEANGHTYRIERGRKPTFFKFIVDNQQLKNETDDAQGENKESQKAIDSILGMSQLMFKHVLCLNTYTEPFLNLGAQKQREIIEELLGIAQLSQKADVLKEKIKNTKNWIEQEEFKIRTIKQSNERIASAVNDLTRKSNGWETSHQRKIKDLELSIESLQVLNIEEEIQAHKDLELYNSLSSSKHQTDALYAQKNRQLTLLNKQLSTTVTNYESISKNKCPTCGQDVEDHNHDKIKSDLESQLVQLDSQIKIEEPESAKLKDEIDKINETLKTFDKPTTFYPSLEQALKHQSTLTHLKKSLEQEMLEQNPYLDQIKSISSSFQEVNYDNINQFSKDKEHQEFLYKLLTNKDSFIRKRIINQNLSYLNIRLSDYLGKLGLPHKVKFLNDLSVEISLLGQELDIGNLSRGESTRLILGLSWAFRDIFENGKQSINLMFIDELIDLGIDLAGVEKSVELLKDMARNRNKNIFVISHREELSARVNNILTVTKENRFTSFRWD